MQRSAGIQPIFGAILTMITRNNILLQTVMHYQIDMISELTKQDKNKLSKDFNNYIEKLNKESEKTMNELFSQLEHLKF